MHKRESAMHFKQLQLFLHLCESRHFAKTANSMHLSPSALSRQIQKLEAELGQTLFERDNRHVLLTSSAHKLRPVAQNILNQWQQLHHELQEDKLRGEIHLFCSVTASYSHLPELLATFRLHHPLIEFVISTGDPAQAIDKVRHGEVDVAIAARPERMPKGLVFAPIGEVPLSLIAPSHPTSYREELTNNKPNWAKLTFIVPESGMVRERAEHWFEQANITPTIYAQVAGHEAIVSMVALGCGIGIAPDVVIENSPVKEKVVRFHLSELKPMQLGVCCKQKQLDNTLIAALWESIKSS